MPNLVLGPILRHVGTTDATLWVETNAPCDVEVLGHRSHTFNVEGHYYAIVYITGLTPGGSHEYKVLLNGTRAWPETDSRFPPSVIHTIALNRPLRIMFGSCRVSLPHEPPYTLKDDKPGLGIDALYALAFRMCHEPKGNWPDALLLLGDQVYADEVSPGTRDFIRSRRNPKEPSGEEIADFEEYTHLYRDSWGDPTIRWLLSTVPSTMIFDDHDMHDDWNISEAWVEKMRAKPWWNERIIGRFMSYWLYQHLGNLSTRELEENRLLQHVRQSEDGGPLLRRFAFESDREPENNRWSFYRDFGKTRLIVMDSRAGRILKGGYRDMIGDRERNWIERQSTGDFDHLLIGTSLPLLLGPGLHYLEAWSEAVCSGAWGKWASKPCEKIRQKLDFDHWSAFGRSFNWFIHLLRVIGSGEHRHLPDTITILSGDVHHAYLAKVFFPLNLDVKSVIYQAVCSPLRNSLSDNQRRGILACWSKTGRAIARALARTAGVKDPDVDWRLVHDEPWFDNQLMTLEIEGHKTLLRIEKTIPGDCKNPRMEKVFEHRLK